ncbi:MAG: PepSY-associated TM helix domain-containing protein [Pseudomonadota bacterium]
MSSTLRQSLNLMHTWVGVIVGLLLFAIFWMGTMSVYDREIDRWMAPMTRLAVPEQPLSFEKFRHTYDAAVAAHAVSWTVLQPTERQPVLRLVYREAASKKLINRYFDGTTGAVLPDQDSLAGTRFLYPFHYSLHIKAWNLGEWIVGAAGMAMLVLCVSGIVIHRRLFADFFTFRPNTLAGRKFFELHTLSGVLGVPFHVIITLSGLIIHFMVYFPSGYLSSYEDLRGFNAEAVGGYQRPKANKPGTLAPLDPMIDEARRLWNGVEPWAVVVRHPGDANAFVTIFQSFDSAIPRYAPAVSFDAATGTLLHKTDPIGPMIKTQRFISGLHQIQFRHWTLRFTYFALGLVGCVLIGTGLLFWLESRRKRHAHEGRSGVRIVEALAVGGVTGIIAATAGFLVINRALPLGTTFLGVGREALEVWTFFLVWIAALAHAWLFPRAAWAQQCRAIAALSLTAVALNWLTTGDHFVRTLSHPHLWGVAGVDVALLLSAFVAMLFARKLSNNERQAGAAVPALAG